MSRAERNRFRQRIGLDPLPPGQQAAVTQAPVLWSYLFGGALMLILCLGILIGRQTS